MKILLPTLLTMTLTAAACSKGAQPAADVAEPQVEVQAEGTSQAPIVLQAGKRHQGACPKGGASYYKYVVGKGPNVKLDLFYVGNLDIFFYPESGFQGSYLSQWGGATGMYTRYGDTVKKWEKVEPGQTILFSVKNNEEEQFSDGRPTYEYGLLFAEYE